MGSSVRCTIKKCKTPWCPTHRYEERFGDDELFVGYLCEHHAKVAEELGWNMVPIGTRTS